MWETIRGYLTFTRKERYGVLFLLLVIGLLFILSRLFKPAVGDPDPDAYKQLVKATMDLDNRLRDSAKSSVGLERYEPRNRDASGLNHRTDENQVSIVMFYFDPNRASAADWQRLGLTPRLTQTIMRYIEKGGQFRKPEDLKKIYGIHTGDYKRLLPYVRIAEISDSFHNRIYSYGKGSPSGTPAKNIDSFAKTRSLIKGYGSDRAGKKPESINVNQADSAAWCRFPGIGAKLASRIVNFRGRLGGFYNIEQVGETFGLTDSVFQSIKYYLQLGPERIRQIDINSAGTETLQAHPYIRWKFAKMIVEYRNQHGAYHAVEELLQLALMDSAKFKKIKPYIAVK
jgi:DNA uptake protein ComE-like DNA-binding protein